MRRLRILLAGVLATGMVAAWSGGAYADQPAAGGFCEQYEGLVDDIEGTDVEDFDFTDPEATQEAFERAADAFRELADEAPKKVKKAFKTAANYYADLAEDEIDLTDPETIGDLVPSGKVAKAFTKIGTYISDECGVDSGTDVEE